MKPRFWKLPNPGRRKAPGVEFQTGSPNSESYSLADLPAEGPRQGPGSQALPLVDQLLNDRFQIPLPPLGTGRTSHFYNRGIQITFLLEGFLIPKTISLRSKFEELYFLNSQSPLNVHARLRAPPFSLPGLERSRPTPTATAAPCSLVSLFGSSQLNGFWVADLSFV